MKIKVTQLYTTERVIEFDVEADTIEEAMELTSSGTTNVPEFADPRWREGWNLQTEVIEPVS